ncbi:MAG: hypothetical protein FJX72_11610 [Armatimonadetes bacterium]|nr:hypothetical protein [Armatimonadota bacterium]
MLSRHGYAGLVCLGAVYPWLGGCSSRAPVATEAYVSVDRLVERHPARLESSKRWSVSVPPTRPVEPNRAASGSVPSLVAQGSQTAPEALRPFIVKRAAPQADDGADAVDQKRSSALRDRLAAQSRAARAREVRLMRATLLSERIEATREREDRIRRLQDAAVAAARPRMRDLDLKIVALQAQRGSPAAGPPEVVERTWREAREARRALDADLTKEHGAIRIREMADLRARLESREADLERALEVSDAQRARDDDMALRQYNEAVAGAARHLPGLADGMLVESVGLGPNHPGYAETDGPRRPRSVSTRARPPGGRVNMDETRIDAAIRADVKAHASRVGRLSGWHVVFERRSGAPDRTDDVLRVLIEERFLR